MSFNYQLSPSKKTLFLSHVWLGLFFAVLFSFTIEDSVQSSTLYAKSSLKFCGAVEVFKADSGSDIEKVAFVISPFGGKTSSDNVKAAFKRFNLLVLSIQKNNKFIYKYQKLLSLIVLKSNKSPPVTYLFS